MNSEPQMLNQWRRHQIYEHVRSRPGLHMRQLERDLGIALGTLEYHLHRLVRSRLLAVRQTGRYKSYFVEGTMDRRDKDFLYFLRHAMPRRIALEILDQPGIRFQVLASKVPVSPSTLSFHLKKLVAAGLVGEARVGREKIYHCPEAERIRRIMVEYGPTFQDQLVDRFAAAWLDLGASPNAPGSAPYTPAETNAVPSPG